MYSKKKIIIGVLGILVLVILCSQIFLNSGFLKDSNRAFTEIYGNNTSVPIAQITLDKTTLSIKVKDKAKLVPSIKPTNATIKTVSWFSRNPKIATVLKDGTVTAVSLGTTKIVAFGGNTFTECSVTVKVP